MTLEEYIANPMGKNNATFTPLMRESVKKSYKAKFDNVMLRENGKIGYYLYKDNKNNAYYIHLKIPSEVIENFYYDVVFKFFTSSDQDTGGGKNLEKYQVQFFSNDPAFVYTYAYVFAHNDLFNAKDLSEVKASDDVLCSIRTDGVILDAISKIITMMVTSNQCLLQSTVINRY